MTDGELPTILFTGFEPSGDDHASAVIRVLKRRVPALRICAWGGPKMRAAGAEIVEETGRDAVMGVPGFKKIQEHRRINQRIEKWLDEHPIAVHVPVDSPAANFPICAMTKARGARVVHMVAPQIWAWGPWRIKKLRRLTDFVCCVLPFEEAYFCERGVPARFIGHPLFDKAPKVEDLDEQVDGWERGGPSVALMPGSRPAEITGNFPLLLQAFKRLTTEHRQMRGRVAATTPEVADKLRLMAEPLGGWPEGLEVAVGQTDAVVRWADLALVVSGTVTLQIALQATPMVIVYKANPVLYNLVGRWLVRTPHYTLPNLIAGRRIVPELVPHFGGAEPIVDEAVALLEQGGAADRQREELLKIADRYRGTNAAEAAARAILENAGIADAGENTDRAAAPGSGSVAPAAG